MSGRSKALDLSTRTHQLPIDWGHHVPCRPRRHTNDSGVGGGGGGVISSTAMRYCPFFFRCCELWCPITGPVSTNKKLEPSHAMHSPRVVIGVRCASFTYIYIYMYVCFVYAYSVQSPRPSKARSTKQKRWRGGQVGGGALSLTASGLPRLAPRWTRACQPARPAPQPTRFLSAP